MSKRFRPLVEKKLDKELSLPEYAVNERGQRVIHVENMQRTDAKWGDKDVYIGKLLDHPRKAPGEWHFVLEANEQGEAGIVVHTSGQGDNLSGHYIVEPV